MEATLYKVPTSDEDLQKYISINKNGYILTNPKNNSKHEFKLHKSTCYSSKKIKVKNNNIIFIESYEHFVDLRSYMLRKNSLIRNFVHSCSQCCSNLNANQYNNEYIEKILIDSISNIKLYKKDKIIEKIQSELSLGISNSLVEVNSYPTEYTSPSLPYITVTKDGHKFHLCINIINGQYIKHRSHISFKRMQPTNKKELMNMFSSILDNNRRNIYFSRRHGDGLAILNISNSINLIESELNKSNIIISSDIQNIHFGITPIMPPYWTASNEVLAAVKIIDNCTNY